MTEQEIRIQLEEMKARSLSGELSAFDHRFIEQNFERITFHTFTKRSCSRCYHDAFIEMYTTLKKYGLRDMANFRLCNGVVLQSAQFSEVITNTNITDEIALLWLKNNPTRINLFSVYPENWESMIAADKLSEEKSKKVRKQKQAKQ